VSRFIKKNYQKLPAFQNDKDYKQKLAMYEKSHQIQTARYIQIDQKCLRKKPESLLDGF